MHLLVVDDDEVDRATIRRYLQQANVRAEIDELTSGDAAVEKALSGNYDCIILDYSLPGTDGVEVVGRLKRAGVTTPILVVAAQDEEVGAALVAAGASDFLHKEDLSAKSLVRRLAYVQRLSRAERVAARARREAESLQQLTQAVLRHLPTGVVVVDNGGAIVMSNPSAELVFGPDCGALRGSGVSVTAELVAAKVAPLLTQAQQEGSTVTAEQPIDHRGRRYRIAATPVGGDSDAGYTVMTLDDITSELQAREAAERGARARQDVLMIVSHDLRGPLSAIQVALDGLIDAEASHEERLRYAGAVTRSVQRADRLVRDLMVAAQLEAGNLRMEWSRTSVRTLLEQAVRDNELLAAGAKMAVVLGEIEDCDLKLDRERMLQALANLVQNALRHAKGTKEVTLAARKVGDSIEVITRDRGPGIAADAMPRLFEPFWQGSSGGKGGKGSAGLGLSIVRGIARAHGGEARAEQAEGGGAQLVIALPLERA